MLEIAKKEAMATSDCPRASKSLAAGGGGAAVPYRVRGADVAKVVAAIVCAARVSIGSWSGRSPWSRWSRSNASRYSSGRRTPHRGPRQVSVRPARPCSPGVRHC